MKQSHQPELFRAGQPALAFKQAVYRLSIFLAGP